MKRYILVFAALIVLLSVVVPASAMDFILGARAGYFVWQPYFKDMKGSGVEELDTGSGILYGPALSVILTENVTFSAVALFGKQSTYWDNENTTKPFGPNTIVSTGNFYGEIDRIDIDTALSYRVSERFKVFAGYKYQFTETLVKGTFLWEDPDPDRLLVLEAIIEVPAHGPALGIGYSQTIGSNFFFSMNLSGLYMFSEHHFARDRVAYYDADGVGQIVSGPGDIQDAATGKTYKTQQMGLNAEPSVGMSVGNVIATLGFRFQWVRIKFIDKPVIDNVQFGPTDWMNDYLYGVFVGALYKI